MTNRRVTDLPIGGLDPRQRARDYRQRHRDNGWTPNERRTLDRIERKITHAEKLASQPPQTSAMETVDALPDPTEEYLGKSLVERTPGGNRSSVNTAIQLADDTIAWSSMSLHATPAPPPPPPPPPAFTVSTPFPVGTINSRPVGVSHKSTHEIWVSDAGDSKLYLATAAGSVLGNIDILATFGGVGGPRVGQIHVLTGVGPDYFWWVYDDIGGGGPGEKLYLHNPNGSFNAGYTIGGSGSPRAISANAADTLIYISNSQSNQVDVWNNSIVHVASTGGAGISAPLGVSVDTNGDLWMSDSGSHIVRKFQGTSIGTQLLQLGTQGVASAAAGQFNAPRGLHADTNGRVFVCDTGNNRIQVFSYAGAYLDQFGSTGAGANQLNAPADITVDGVTGSAAIFIADRGNARIAKWIG